MADRDDSTKAGKRQNGSPFKDGNVRDDGSYEVGKYRAPEHTRFAKGDGSQRGRRAKGTRNLATDWKEELAEKIEVNEGGKRKTISKQRGVVKTVMSRAMKGDVRAAQIVLHHGNAQEIAASRVRLPDREVLARWAAQMGYSPETPPVLDDFDRLESPAGEGDHGDQ